MFGLSACSSDEAEPAATPSPAETTPAEQAEPTPEAAPTTSSPNLDAITVEGEPGEAPEVTVPAPFGVDETMTKVLTPGDGATVGENATVDVHYLGVNGRTGEPFDDSYSRGDAPVPFSLDQVVPGFQKGLAGQRVGSRVLIAMPGTDGYDSSGGSPQAGIEVGDTLVFVADIVSAPLEEAEGEPVEPREGLPTVEFTDGKPTVTIPEGPAPTELQVQLLVRGNGKPVAETDTITARYQAVKWSDGSVVTDTYGEQPEQGPLSSLIPAWKEGLKDQPVGSRVLIVSPPEMAYPEDADARDPNPAQGETQVYVVDILHASAGM